MKMLITIVAAIFVAGFALASIQENLQDARNRDAVKRAALAGSGERPGSTAEQDARHRQRAEESPAGARYRQSQQ